MAHDTAEARGMNAVAEGIVRWRFLLALFGVISLVLAYPISANLAFDRRIESLFAEDDPDLIAYRELKEAFGGNAVALLVYRDPELTSQSGIDRNRRVTEEVKALEGVSDVLSTSRLSDAMRKFRFSLTSSTTPDLFRKDDPVASGFDAIFAGYTHSADHQRAAVVALLEADHPPQTIEQLKRIAESLTEQTQGGETQPEGSRGAVIVGEPVLVHDGLSLIERDGARLASITVALLSLVVILCLADIRFVLLMSVTILWSVIITRATMVMIGVQLSLVSSVLTAIVTVVSVTAVLHLGVRYRRLRWQGIQPVDASIATLTPLLTPIFWTCATDAVGFFALYASRVSPIRQFGLMIAVASMAVFAGLLLFSGLMLMLPGRQPSKRDERERVRRTGIAAYQHRMAKSIRKGCLWLADRSIAASRWLMVATAVLTVLSVLGVSRMETETSFLNNFRGKSPISAAYREVEMNFGGAGVWDIILDAPTALSAEYLDEVRQLETRLREIDVSGAKLAKVLSIADAEAVIAESKFAELLPVSSRLSAMYVALPGFFDALYSNRQNEPSRLRIMLRSREQLDAAQKSQLIGEVERVVVEHTSSDRWHQVVGDSREGSDSREGRVTGYHVLMARLIGQLLGDQWRCFAASSLLVWLLLAVATRSLPLATAALLPNLLPVFVVLAILGSLGGRINMGAAMIAAVSIGISIDGSVHLLLAYLNYRRSGHGLKRSTIMSAASIGVPVLLATAALVLGFGVLATSEFVPTATFGLLVSVTLALGTLVNLTLLPAFVMIAHAHTNSRRP